MSHQAKRTTHRRITTTEEARELAEATAFVAAHHPDSNPACIGRDYLTCKLEELGLSPEQAARLTVTLEDTARRARGRQM